MHKLILLISLLFIVVSRINAQKSVTLNFITNDYKKVKKNIPEKLKDSSEAILFLRNFQLLSVKRGYLLASIDSLRFKKDTITVSFYVGPKFEKAQFHLSSDNLKFLSKHSSLREKQLSHVSFRPNEVAKIFKSIQEAYLNNGYPFVKTHLVEIDIDATNLRAKIITKPGSAYKIKDVNIKGDSTVSKAFITNLVDIHPGDEFNESKLKLISSKISGLPYLKEIKSHELLFTNEGVELFLYLQNVPVSSINGVLGLQPNPVTSRVNLTGNIDLKLTNVLHRGESFGFNWRNIQVQTQALQMKLNYPFLFKTKFGIDAQFQLYKRDSTFLELKPTFGVQYFLKGGNYFRAFYQLYSSNILYGAGMNPNFQNLSQIKSNAYGIALYKRQLDYIPNPTRGFQFNIETAIASRSSKLKDSLQTTNSTTYRLSLHGEYFIPFKKRNVIHFTVSGEFFQSPEIFQNEVFRFGGLNSFRGFNEEELYATSRTVMSVEYRFLLDKNSHVFMFYDQAFYENRSSKYYRDQPFGFGAGLSFGTNLGLFSISYALGKQFDNPILLKNGKIHFGYIYYF